MLRLKALWRIRMIDNKKFSRAKKAPVVTNNTKYRPGDVVSLKVVRANENAAFLDAGTGNTSDDIMLHKLQQTSDVNVGDEVKVYLYLDPSRTTLLRILYLVVEESQYARLH